MPKNLYHKGLCILMDRGSRNAPAFERAMDLIAAGARWIQLRDKSATPLQLFKTARLLRTLTTANDTVLIINDYAHIALAVEADGVHLGQDDLPLSYARKIMGNRIIGISTHTLSQALEAQQEGADYIGFGPLFDTATKDAGPSKGLDALAEVTAKVSIPVVAIGGIKIDAVSGILQAGAQALAVSSAIMKKREPSKAAGLFIDAITAFGQKNHSNR